MAHVLAGSLGVSAIVLAGAELFTGLQLIGSAYLIWIGLRTFRSARRDALTVLDGGSASPPVGPRRAFREGVLVEALNPKTTAFLLAFDPQFMDPSAGHVAPQFVVLGFVSVAPNALADIVVAFTADGIRDGAAGRPGLIRRLREAPRGFGSRDGRARHRPRPGQAARGLISSSIGRRVPWPGPRNRFRRGEFPLRVPVPGSA
ncbi:LysE family translocator [Roseomonas sp. GCM10028921]